MIVHFFDIAVDIIVPWVVMSGLPATLRIKKVARGLPDPLLVRRLSLPLIIVFIESFEIATRYLCVDLVAAYEALLLLLSL